MPMKPFPKRGKNRDLLVDFGQYCANHPEERFWQALRNWSGNHMILIFNATKIGGLPENSPQDLKDTFYFEDKNR